MTNENVSKIEILDESLREGFSPMPRVVLRSPKLTMQAKTLYALLLDYAWQKGSCFPGQGKLAKDLDVHKNTIYKHLIELRDFKLIDWKQRGFNRTNIYYILPINTRFAYKHLEAHSSVTPESHPSVDQESHPSVNIIEKDEYKKNKYKQLLTTNENLNNSTFDKEAIALSKELKDEKNIRYYQSVVNKKKSGELTDDDIQTALNQTRKALSESIHDGTGFLHNAGAWFTACLKRLESSRKEDNKLSKFDELKNLLLEKKKLK